MIIMGTVWTNWGCADARLVQETRPPRLPRRTRNRRSCVRFCNRDIGLIDRRGRFRPLRPPRFGLCDDGVPVKPDRPHKARAERIQAIKANRRLSGIIPVQNVDPSARLNPQITPPYPSPKPGRESVRSLLATKQGYLV